VPYLVSTGSAGLIQTIRLFVNHTWGAAVLGLIATIGWTIQGLGNAYYFREVRTHRSLGCSMAMKLIEYGLGVQPPHSRGSYNGKGGYKCTAVGTVNLHLGHHRQRPSLPVMVPRHTLQEVNLLFVERLKCYAYIVLVCIIACFTNNIMSCYEL